MKGGEFRHYNTKPPKSAGNHVLPLFSLKGKTAIISGAGAGIGLAVAQAFAEAGANVAIWYNTNKKALDRAEEIEKEYGVKCTPRGPASIIVEVSLMILQAKRTKSTSSTPRTWTKQSKNKSKSSTGG